MRKFYFFLFACANTAIYWAFDAYAKTLLYHSSLPEELFMVTSNTIPLLKIATAMLIFFGTLMPLLMGANTTSSEEKIPVDEYKILNHLSELLFSSLSTKVNVSKALEMLEKSIGLEASILFLYKEQTMSLYNENAFIKSNFRTKEINPIQASYQRSDVENAAVGCFVQKLPFYKDEVKGYTLICIALKTEKDEKAIGSLMLVTRDVNEMSKHQNIINRFLQMVHFALSLEIKKEAMMALNTQYAGDVGSYDHLLDILNYSKMQQFIEREYKKFKRYHTPLCIVLIQINAFKNINNIFPSEVTTTFKKEFIQLIKKSTREVDIFAKWSNDQYALLLPNVDFRAGQGAARKLQRIIADVKFAHVGQISCSFGITSLAPQDTIVSFRSRAESALATAALRDIQSGAIETKLYVDLVGN